MIRKAQEKMDLDPLTHVRVGERKAKENTRRGDGGRISPNSRQYSWTTFL
jgi:hypothetical protein